MLTLYPAAYPSPGKSDVNLRTTPSPAYCLKMTEFRFEADVISQESARTLELSFAS